MSFRKQSICKGVQGKKVKSVMAVTQKDDRSNYEPPRVVINFTDGDSIEIYWGNSDWLGVKHGDEELVVDGDEGVRG